ncbi:hypothetical protein ACSBR2_025312 [Camellia fascicularis]
MAKRTKAISGSTSSETSPPASEEVTASNVDLLSDILLRVPPKSLLTFNSCNGLLLCNNGRTVGNPNNYKLRLIVCNPTTQKYTLLPQLPKCEFLASFLAFHPSKSPHYKVVLYRLYDEFEIYSSENVSWKLVTVGEPLGICVKGVFWNGAIHWLKEGDREFHFRFDVDEDKLLKTPISPEPKIVSTDDISYYGECGGHLILTHSPSRFAMQFKILEMERDTFDWVVKCRVNLRRTSPLLSDDIDFRRESYIFHVICVVKEEDDFALVMATAGEIVYYNVKCKTRKVLRQMIP